MSIVLGIHGGVYVRQHEASACVVVDGVPVALCEEERYLRQKGAYGRLPTNAVADALALAGHSIHDVDLVVTPGVTYFDGFAERIAEWLKHHFGHAPKIEAVHHQAAHCAAAFFGSGFKDATVVSLDASGDGCAGFVSHGKNGKLNMVQRVPTQNSLGYFYTMMTYYLGFEEGDEYKVMGLAPYGRRGAIDLSDILALKPGGWHFASSDYLRDDPPPVSPFEPSYDRDAVERLMKCPNRRPRDPIGSFHKDVAWAVQDRFEAAYLNFLEEAKRQCGNERNLAIAGGCALNCSANRKLFYNGEFANVYVSPVASDRGLSLGCAYLGAHYLGDAPAPLKLPYLGHHYSGAGVRAELVANGVSFFTVSDPASHAADRLASGSVIGWFQGRSEAGARALGNRSILAPANDAKYRDLVNERVKLREDFRPFAPVVPTTHAEDYFDTRGKEFPTMSVTLDAIGAHRMPAVVHVDGTARVQTLAHDDNPMLHELLRLYHTYSGSPVLLNTSFNLKGQPIVETPRDALMTFFGSGLDALIIGDCVVTK